MRLLIIIVSMFAFIFSSLSEKAEAGRKSRLVITGTVVGYDQLMPLTSITSAPQVAVLIVRVDKRISGREKSRYIKVVHRRLYGGEAELPSEIFDSKKRWRFKLSRQPSCDSSLQELESAKGKIEDGAEVSVPRLKRTSGAEVEDIPTDVVLPCYELHPRDFKLNDSARRKQ
jgi:hypothetical protein